MENLKSIIKSLEEKEDLRELEDLFDYVVHSERHIEGVGYFKGVLGYEDVALFKAHYFAKAISISERKGNAGLTDRFYCQLFKHIDSYNYSEASLFCKKIRLHELYKNKELKGIIQHCIRAKKEDVAASLLFNMGQYGKALKIGISYAKRLYKEKNFEWAANAFEDAAKYAERLPKKEKAEQLLIKKAIDAWRKEADKCQQRAEESIARHGYLYNPDRDHYIIDRNKCLKKVSELAEALSLAGKNTGGKNEIRKK